MTETLIELLKLADEYGIFFVYFFMSLFIYYYLFHNYKQIQEARINESKEMNNKYTELALNLNSTIIKLRGFINGNSRKNQG